MEKGFRLVKCPGLDCPVTLRLNVSEKNYGKTIEATCPRCGAKCRTTIPKPAEKPQVKPPVEPFNFRDFSDLSDLFGKDAN